MDRAWALGSAVAVLLLAGSLTAAHSSALQASGKSTAATAGSAAPLPIETGWGPTAEEIEQARALVDGMSVAERAGQVLVVSYTGTSAPTALVNDLHLGGIVSFASNITGPDQIRHSHAALQASAASAGRTYPVMTAVDQEGGHVSRLTTGATRFPSLMNAGAARHPTITKREYTALAGEIADVGFNVDFAPDADVTVGPADPAIGARSAGSSPDRVVNQSGFARAGVEVSGLIPVLKHFPGHGSVTTDSHIALPVQRKSLAALRKSDLLPFQSGIDAGAPAIMVGHNDVRAIDPGVPSSLSRKVVTGLLRNDMGFKGLAITDSLQMGAVIKKYGAGGAAVRALNAGDDVLLMPSGAKVVRDAIVDAVHDGRIDPRRLDQAATRMIALLLHEQHQGVHAVTPGTSNAVADAIAAAGITSVAGPCSGRMVGKIVNPTGPAEAVANFKAAAQDAGLPTGPHGWTIRLIGYHGSPAKGGVIVAMETPYVLGQSHANLAKFATYSDTPASMRALVSVLLGHSKAPGKLPVHVAGVPRTSC
jgi:beta-N-acetylhexosaminidase